MRRSVISGSNSHRILRRRRGTYTAPIIERIRYPTFDTDNPALIYDRETEPIAFEYLKHIGFDVRKVGLCLDPYNLGIGASLDGMVTIDGIEGTVEIKCPYIGREGDTATAMKDKKCNISKSFKWTA